LSGEVEATGAALFLNFFPTQFLNITVAQACEWGKERNVSCFSCVFFL
jgi:hypothetical protein